jgi:hypothetical protein
MRAPLKSKAVGTSSDKFLGPVAPLVMRWALGLTILSAVADRFGLWGHQERPTLVGANGPTSSPIPPWSTAFYPLIGLTHWPLRLRPRRFCWASV